MYRLSQRIMVTRSKYVFMFKTRVSTQNLFVRKIFKMIYSYPEVVKSRWQNNDRNRWEPRVKNRYKDKPHNYHLTTHKNVGFNTILFILLKRLFYIHRFNFHMYYFVFHFVLFCLKDYFICISLIFIYIILYFILLYFT